MYRCIILAFTMHLMYSISLSVSLHMLILYTCYFIAGSKAHKELKLYCYLTCRLKIKHILSYLIRCNTSVPKFAFVPKKISTSVPCFRRFLSIFRCILPLRDLTVLFRGKIPTSIPGFKRELSFQVSEDSNMFRSNEQNGMFHSRVLPFKVFVPFRVPFHFHSTFRLMYRSVPGFSSGRLFVPTARLEHVLLLFCRYTGMPSAGPSALEVDSMGKEGKANVISVFSDLTILV